MAKNHILSQFHIFFPNLDEIYSLMPQFCICWPKIVVQYIYVFMFTLMASFVAKIYGPMTMVGNSLTGQFQNFELELFTNSASCHGFAFVKQKYRCRASNFSNCPLIVAFYAVKYDRSNMARMTATNPFKARYFGGLWKQWFIFVFLDNSARGDLIYNVLLKKVTWLLRYKATHFRKMSLSFVFDWASKASTTACHTQQYMY